MHLELSLYLTQSNLYKPQQDVNQMDETIEALVLEGNGHETLVTQYARLILSFAPP